MVFNEDLLKRFSAPLSDTEDQMCKNAIGMVRDALKSLGFTDDNKEITPMVTGTSSYSLELRNTGNSRKIKIFVQGSYANNTNVRTQSDVDIAVVQEEVFVPKYRDGVNASNYGITSLPFPSKSFKDEVQECLITKFGRDVERKNKSIKIHGNSYRKDADTVPCMRHRDYTDNFTFNPNSYIAGIWIKADDGSIVVNYPEQHIENGRTKNNNTNYYFKKTVRIVKNIKYVMVENHILSANTISSFGLESLVWNIPDNIFMKQDCYRHLINEIILFLYINSGSLYYYKEVNGIKKLCPNLTDINNYKSFISDLLSFYQVGE
jgi:hypothetical protein